MINNIKDTINNMIFTISSVMNYSVAKPKGLYHKLDF